MNARRWPFGQTAAIIALREVLLSGEHRVAWMRYANRSVSAGRINGLAVVRRLVDAGVWGSQATVGQVKDTVYRALSEDPARQLLTPGTLARFIYGFGFSEAEAGRLWALMSGSDPDSVQPVTGRTETAMRTPAAAPGPPRAHLTVSLHEFHYIGPDGLPQRHRTVQVIRSQVESLTSYTYQIDTDAARLRVVRGGRIGEQGWVDERFYAFNIVLSRPLRRAETASIEYETTFSYSASPPPEFRRAARGRVENLELYLQFHRARVPRQVWWSEWDSYLADADPVNQERVRLDTELSVHRYLPYIERAVVGYRWDW